MAARSLTFLILLACVACAAPGVSAGRRLLQASPGPIRGVISGIGAALSRDNITIARNGPIDATIKLDGKVAYTVLGQSGGLNVTVPKVVIGAGAPGSGATVTTGSNNKPAGGSVVAGLGVDVAIKRPLAGTTVNINHATLAGIAAGTTTGTAGIEYKAGNKAKADLAVGGTSIIQAGVSDSILTGGRTIGVNGAQLVAIFGALGK